MEKDLKKILDEIDFYHQSEDIDYDLFNKIKTSNDLNPGDKVELFWKDREESDKGYIFQLPHQQADEFDLCIHFYNVDNSDGIGEADDEFHHLYHICSLERVEKLIAKNL